MSKIIGTPIIIINNSGGGGSSVDNFSTLPPPVANLTAEAGDATVTLSFEAVPEEYEQYLSDETAYIVVLKQGSVPESPTDGYVVKLNKDGLVVTEGGAINGEVAGIALKDLPEGTLVNIMEGGVLTPFYLAKHDYEADLNEGGRELLVRKDIYSTMQWNTTGINNYSGSTLDVFLNDSYTNLFTSEIIEKIGTTFIEYTIGNGNTNTAILERSVFALSATELGKTSIYMNIEGEALDVANDILLTNYNGAASSQWTRSATINTVTTDSTMVVNAAGSDVSAIIVTYTQGVRPAFTLPNDMRVVTTPNVIDGSYDLIVSKTLTLDEVVDGAILMIEEDGVEVPFYVAKHDYESGLNDEGRILLVRKEEMEQRAWHSISNSSASNAYATSDIDAYLNNDYKSLLGSDVQEFMGETAFYYTPKGNDGNTVTSLLRSIFLLSLTEFGLSNAEANIEGSALPIASLLRALSSAGTQYTRTPALSYSNAVFGIDSSTGNGADVCTVLRYYRPAFTLPSNLEIIACGNNTYSIVGGGQ